MSKLKLDKKQILEIQQNEDPYLFVDYATEVVPGVSAKGYKKFEDSGIIYSAIAGESIIGNEDLVILPSAGIDPSTYRINWREN